MEGKDCITVSTYVAIQPPFYLWKVTLLLRTIVMWDRGQQNVVWHRRDRLPTNSSIKSSTNHGNPRASLLAV